MMNASQGTRIDFCGCFCVAGVGLSEVNETLGVSLAPRSIPGHTYETDNHP
ncbi:hypothetical protein Fuma_02012 [Fuerstiella marisgermanici]|uniref:Uncharacterized protein n=1 Tax=Fuerstiella marisgermanici TaxID=1891926 RepID=A0A1P8WEC3_9PLAN|nr:hypothetical protein Fuma_02012 [Fuerstiella marisgermanici]